MKFFKILAIVSVTSSFVTGGRADEVRKEYLFNNWWDKFLIMVFGDKEDRTNPTSPCSTSFFPPVKDIILLDQMLETEFRRRPKVFKRGIPAQMNRVPRNEEKAATGGTSEPTTASPPTTTTTPSVAVTSEPKLVKMAVILPDRRVCFGIHQLHHKYPKVAADRAKFDAIVNSFITYVNHKNEYPHKIAKMEFNL